MGGKESFQGLNKHQLKILMSVVLVAIITLVIILFSELHTSFNIPLYLEKSPDEIQTMLGKPVSQGYFSEGTYLIYKKDLMLLFLMIDPLNATVSKIIVCSKSSETSFPNFLKKINLNPEAQEYYFYDFPDSNCVMTKPRGRKI